MEALRQDVELLKLKLEVVQLKLRVQETELQGVRTGGTDDMRKRAGSEEALAQLQAAEYDLQASRKKKDEYHRRYLSMLEQNRRAPGSVPKDELEATLLQRDNYAFEEKSKESVVTEKRRRIPHAAIEQRMNGVEIALEAVQNAGDKESRQRATAALEKAMQKLREELRKQDDPKNER